MEDEDRPQKTEEAKKDNIEDLLVKKQKVSSPFLSFLPSVTHFVAFQLEALLSRVLQFSREMNHFDLGEVHADRLCMFAEEFVRIGKRSLSVSLYLFFSRSSLLSFSRFLYPSPFLSLLVLCSLFLDISRCSDSFSQWTPFQRFRLRRLLLTSNMILCSNTPVVQKREAKRESRERER